MIINLNSPYRSESFAGDMLGEKTVTGSFETSEYYANKGLVTPWARKRRNSLLDKANKKGKKPVTNNWKNDTID